MRVAAKFGAYRLLVGYLLAAGVAGFAFYFVFGRWNEFVMAVARVEPWRIPLSLLACLIALAVNSLAFVAACRAREVKISARTLGAVWLGSLLSKYVPIGVGHMLGRGILLTGHRVPARSTIEIGVFEQCVSLFWCALIAALAWLVAKFPGALLPLATVISLALATLLATAIRRRDALGWAAASILGYGVAMMPYASAYMIVIAPDVIVQFVGALFAGTVSGVIAFVSPGGLGVREAVAALILPDADAAKVLGGMVAVRALIVGSEVFASAVGQWILLRTKART